MRKTPVRVVLVLLALAAIAGASFYVYTLEQRAGAMRDAGRAFSEDALRLQATLADLRAAHPGYLAAGQSAAVWIEKVAQLRQQADAELRRLAATSGIGPEAEADLAVVGESLSSFGRFDDRIRELLRDEQPLTASDLLFTNASQVLSAASAALASMRGVRASAEGAGLSTLRRTEVYALGGAAGLTAIVLLLLLPVGRGDRGPEDDEEAEAVSSPGGHVLAAGIEPRPGLHLDLDLSRPRREARPPDELELPARLSHAGGASTTDPPAEDARRATPAPSAAASIDLPAAARLCTDLARVRDTSELQGLLARAAVLLDASGIVVWMSSVEGGVLWPAFSYGYSPQTLARMQALPCDGSTPVSVAFRKGALEVVPSEDRTSGAIVAPILASSGSVGVMAVEIRHGAETSDAEQALAGIIAAQLATLVAGD